MIRALFVWISAIVHVRRATRSAIRGGSPRYVVATVGVSWGVYDLHGRRFALARPPGRESAEVIARALNLGTRDERTLSWAPLATPLGSG